MKNSSVYQDLKIQFLYFFVAYELLKTTNVKLFAILFLLLIADVLYNSKNVIQIINQINVPMEVDIHNKYKKWKLNGFLLATLFFCVSFLIYVTVIRKDFWILLF
jgi:hypothetical protein